jgi:hypothetical protein
MAHRPRVAGHERERRDRGSGTGVGEHLVEKGVGRVERVCREQAGHEVVEESGDVEPLVAQQPAAREGALDVGRRVGRGLARPGALEREARQHESLPRRRALEAGAALEAARRGRARLQARLLGVSRELRLEDQSQLPVGGVHYLDGGLERADGAVGLSGHCERERQLAHGRCEALWLSDPVHGCAEVVDRPRRRHSQLRGAQLEQHVDLCLGGRRLRERAPKPGGRGPGGPAGEGVRGHPAEERHPLGGAVRRRGGDLRGDPFLGCAARSEHVGGTGMGLGPFERADVRVDGLAHDRVREFEPRALLEDGQRDQQIGRPRGLVLRDVGQPGHVGEARAVAEHGDRAHHGGSRRGPVGETQQHGLRHRGWADAAHTLRLARIRREPPLIRLAEQRLEEEGISARGVAAGRRELRRHALAEPAPESVTVASRLSGPGRSTVVSGPAARRARSGATASPLRVEASTATASPSMRGAR